MRGGTLHHPWGVRPSRSLVVRAGLARTFGSLAGFLVVGFLFLGIYILADAFANPINAEAAAVISAAFSIALGAVLLFYLIRPGRSYRARDSAHRHGGSADSAIAAQPPFIEPAKTAHQGNLRNNLPYQHSYIDHSRIRR